MYASGDNDAGGPPFELPTPEQEALQSPLLEPSDVLGAMWKVGVKAAKGLINFANSLGERGGIRLGEVCSEEVHNALKMNETVWTHNTVPIPGSSREIVSYPDLDLMQWYRNCPTCQSTLVVDPRTLPVP